MPHSLGLPPSVVEDARSIIAELGASGPEEEMKEDKREEKMEEEVEKEKVEPTRYFCSFFFFCSTQINYMCHCVLCTFSGPKTTTMRCISLGMIKFIYRSHCTG
jgi:hypothetical protein